MQIRRPGTKGYEEVDGVNITGPSNSDALGLGSAANNAQMAPEFELASVSVVPDGNISFGITIFVYYLINIDF
jgi:hypothetical protein